MQKFLTDSDQDHFQKAMDLYLSEGWTVVPGTLQVSMAACAIGWNESGRRPSFKTQFAVVIDNGKDNGKSNH